MTEYKYIACGYDHPRSLQKGCYAFYKHERNLEILRKCNGVNLPLRFYDEKDKRSRFHVEIKKYTWRELGDKELAHLINIYKWVPLENFSTDWRILIEFDTKDIILPKSLKEESSNKITNYFKKQ